MTSLWVPLPPDLCLAIFDEAVVFPDAREVSGYPSSLQTMVVPLCDLPCADTFDHASASVRLIGGGGDVAPAL